MFFFKKKKLLEMDEKLDNLIMLMKQQGDMIELLKDKIDIIDKESRELNTIISLQIKSQTEATSQVKNEIVASAEQQMDRIDRSKTDVLETLNRVESQMESLLNHVSKTAVESHNSIISETREEINKMSTIIKETGSCLTDGWAEQTELLKHNIFYSAKETYEALDKNNKVIIDLINRKTEFENESLESLENDLRLLLLNSVMEQLPE